MSTIAAEPVRRARPSDGDDSRRTRPSRAEGLAIAERRKAARRRRTARIRKGVTVVAVAAFAGPFAVIYQHIAEDKGPALATSNKVVAVKVSSSLTSGRASASAAAKREAASKAAALAATSTASGSTNSSGSATVQSTPTPVTTSQS